MPEDKDIWQIERFRAQLTDLERRQPEQAEPASEVARSTLAEFGSALEELQVAESELRAQNEELLATRAELEAERGRYQALFELAPDSYLVTTPQGRILEANRAAAELLAIGHEHLTQKIITVFVSPENRHAFRERLNRLPERDRVYDWEIVLQRRDGGRVAVSASVATDRDERGRPVGLRWLLRDISKVKHIEAERDAAQAMLAHRVMQLEVLHGIDQAILNARSPEEIAAQTAARLRALAGCALVTVSTFDHEHGEAERLAVDTARPMALTRGERRPIADYNPVYPEDPRGSLSISDITQAPHVPDICQALAAEGLRSFLSLPLRADGQVIGVLNLANEEPGAFADGIVAAARQVADSLAVALQNARLTEALRANRRELQSLSRRLVNIQEAERAAIARELHDEVGQAIVSLMLGLRSVQNAGPFDAQFKSRMDAAQHIADQVLSGLHRLAVDLRPASLDRLGLVPALHQSVAEFQEKTGLAAQFITAGLDDQRISPDVATALYRLVQEALTNIVRHAQAHHIGVVLERRDDLLLAIVEDDGIGFDVQARLAAEQLGLVGMRERVEALGGQLTIDSGPERGTTVFAEVPFERAYPDR